jgi:uncharacterized phage-associated protein
MKTYTAAELAEVIESHDKWLSVEKGGSRADLSGADLSDAKLYRANLPGANLSDANLYGANLSGTDLSGADLSDANLSCANLSCADLSDANLSCANLSCANLYGADLSGANLSGANLSGADLYGANLSCADLSGANLSGADLRCMGNMNNIKTIQADIWQVGYTHDTLQIDCQRHLIAKWKTFSDKEIRRMGPQMLPWWKIWKPILMNIIEASPANPTKLASLK